MQGETSERHTTLPFPVPPPPRVEINDVPSAKDACLKRSTAPPRPSSFSTFHSVVPPWSTRAHAVHVRTSLMY